MTNIFEAEPIGSYAALEAEDPEAYWEFQLEDPSQLEMGWGGVGAAIARAQGDERQFRRSKGKWGGYYRYGGGRVDQRLKALRANRLLVVSDADIDMLQRIANVETGGLVQGINSYDSAFMSMGFMQWTIKYTDGRNPDGKLQRLIKRAPRAFQRYGIELNTMRYSIPAGNGQLYRPLAIKGAPRPGDLRSLDWAKRFFAAGLDTDVIVAQVKLALEIIEEVRQRLANDRRVGTYFLAHYTRSPVLRALIQETFNNRPLYLIDALATATAVARKTGTVSTEQYLELVRKAITQAYVKRAVKEGGAATAAGKASNLIRKTAQLVMR